MFSRSANSSSPSGPYRKPRADLYTVLLAIALLAILVGILFLYLEMQIYEFQFKGAPQISLQWTPADPQRSPATGNIGPALASHRWRFGGLDHTRTS